LRKRILESSRARDRDPPAAPPVDDEVEEADGSDPRPGLTDRIGGRRALLAALNRDFLPLASECIDQANERTANIRGMLAFEVDVVADSDLGAIIEGTRYPVRNEVHDEELLDCIRETAMSTSLPPPSVGGQETFLITMPMEAD